MQKQPFTNSVLLTESDVKFLLVDDNPMNLEVIEGALLSGGYQHFEKVNEPLSLSKVLAEKSFDLVLLDINMPILNGFAVLSFLQQQLQEKCPPVIMLTALNDQEHVNKALDAGASDYITKPFNRRELLKRVEIHLTNWLLTQQLSQERSSLEQKVHKRTEQIRQSQLEVINRLGQAAEYRDNETGNHVKRVAIISEAIAREVGCSEHFCSLIYLASPLHDVGKIGISDTIMLKPGKLTDEEFDTMKSHVQIGGEILANSDSEILEMAYEIAMTHHEKFNGKGYPHGLTGYDIPLSGRIVAIADVFDALTSSRPYKEAWPVDKAIELIIREKEQHFDSDLVNAFIRVVEPTLEKIKRYSD